MRRFFIFLLFVLPSVVLAEPGWNVERHGNRIPLEFSYGRRMMPPNENPLQPRADIFTISAQGERTRLDYVGLFSDLATEVPISGTAGDEFNFGVSVKVAYDPSGFGMTSWIRNGQVMAVDVRDGKPGTPVTVASQQNYGETQIAYCDLGFVLLAYNFRQQRAEVFLRNAIGTWTSIGNLPIGFVCAGILNGPRMVMDVDKKTNIMTVGWSESGPVLNYYVQRFLIPTLAVMSTRLALPVSFRTNKVTELGFEMVGLIGALILTDINNRYWLYALSFDGAPRYLSHDLGAAPANLIGGVALAINGLNVFTAVMRQDGLIDFAEWWLGLMFAATFGDFEDDLPSVATNIPAEAGMSFPMFLEPGGRGTPMRFIYPGSVAVASFTGCTNGRSRLCTSDRRFEITANWRDSQDNTGSGRAVPLSSDTGYFWFFGSSNVELVVKVLNGCGFNDRFWVFAGGLTDVQVDLTVHDTQSGETKTYHNPSGTAFKPIQDTSAFATCFAGLKSPPHTFATFDDDIAEETEVPLPTMVSAASALVPGLDACAGSDTSLCVSGSRFRLEANWKTSDGRSGVARAVRLTDDSGYFWFFDQKNVELVAKVLNACTFSATHWVFAAGLTDVEVELVATDTNSGATKRYTNAQGSAFQPIQDTSAFSTCP